jgi:hypothetical protein
MKKNALVHPLILAVMLSFGFAAAWGIIGMWAVEVFELMFAAKDVEDLHFLTDGTPCISHRSAGENQIGRYTDLQGNPITLAEDQDTWPGTLLAAKLPERRHDGNVPWRDRIYPLGDGRSPTTRWFFVSDGHRDGTAYFVAYDTETKTRIGYLGLAGFRPTPPPQEELIPFVGSGSFWGQKPRVFVQNSQPGIRQARAPRGFVSPGDIYIIGRFGKLYHADLRSRTMEVVLDDPHLRSALLLPDHYQSNPTKRGALFRLAIRTEDELLVTDEHGKVLRRYPIPEAGRRHDLTVMETAAGEAIMSWKLWAHEATANAKFEHEICWVAPDGRHRETRIALRSGMLVMSPPQMGIAFPSPLLLGGGIAFFLTPDRMAEKSMTFRQAVAEELRQFWPALAIAQLFAAGLAILCYRRQVRYGVGRMERIAWPLFVMLFGVPGWFGYRFGRSWPVLEACPDCGVAVPRDREGCLRCTNDFPRPALKGTEVFA